MYFKGVLSDGVSGPNLDHHFNCFFKPPRTVRVLFVFLFSTQLCTYTKFTHRTRYMMEQIENRKIILKKIKSARFSDIHR